MGEVEQFRMSMPSEGKVPLGFAPDDALERALLNDVRAAWNNLAGYLARRQQVTGSER